MPTCASDRPRIDPPEVEGPDLCPKSAPTIGGGRSTAKATAELVPLETTPAQNGLASGASKPHSFATPAYHAAPVSMRRLLQGLTLEPAQDFVAAFDGGIKRRLGRLLTCESRFHLLSPDIAQLDHIAEAKPPRVLGRLFID